MCLLLPFKGKIFGLAFPKNLPSLQDSMLYFLSLEGKALNIRGLINITSTFIL